MEIFFGVSNIIVGVAAIVRFWKIDKLLALAVGIASINNGLQRIIDS